MSAFANIITLAALIATLLTLAAGHSWIEEYQVIIPNGSFVGARGYSRGYIARDNPAFNGESLKYMLPSLDARMSDNAVRSRINGSDLLCHPAQRTSNYTAEFPKLKVHPGDYVAMKYLENGHTSLPWNITGKPPGGGTVYVFGTTQPSDTEKIANVMKWNEQGTGGDKRGFLMTSQNFDDGRCTQLNCGSISQQRQLLQPNHVAGQPTSTIESWCETDLKIPDNAKPGMLTVYWVWQWPTEPNRDCNTPAGKDEYYTTCADFEVLGGDGTNNKAALAPFSADAGANPQSVAVKDFKSRTAYSATPSFIAISNDKVVGRIASVKPAFVSACSAQASVIQANNLAAWPQVYVPASCPVVSSFGAAAASSAAALYSQAQASYAAQSSSAWAAAFKAASMAVPSQRPWSFAPSTGGGGAQMTATSAPQGMATSTSTSAPPSAPAYDNSSTSTLVALSSSAAGGAVTNVYTVTTILTLTSTLPPGQAAPSASTPAGASDPPASSEIPSATSSSISSPPAASSPATAAAPGIHTITTVGIPSVAPNGIVDAGYRRHARHLPPHQ